MALISYFRKTLPKIDLNGRNVVLKMHFNTTLWKFKLILSKVFLKWLIVIRVVYGSHFWLIFRFHFQLILWIWQGIQQNELKIKIKISWKCLPWTPLLYYPDDTNQGYADLNGSMVCLTTLAHVMTLIRAMHICGSTVCVSAWPSLIR